MSRRATAAAALGAVGFLVLAFGAHVGLAAAARLTVCGGALAAAAIVDLAERRIPNRLTIPALLVLLAVWVASGAPIAQVATGLVLAVALLGVSVLAPAAIGMGDAKLALVIAFGLADKAAMTLAVALMLAGAVAAAGLLIGAAGRSGTLPLAPFFAAGALIALLA
jgi:leader peptidase (prepilin peptidase) / N-methyltransferase